jgi:hypothetical protein
LKKYVLAKRQGVGFVGPVKKENHHSNIEPRKMRRAIND